MPKRVVIEEFHLTILVPCRLPATEADAIQQTLNDALFQARMLHGVRRVFRRETSLKKAKVRLSR